MTFSTSATLNYLKFSDEELYDEIMVASEKNPDKYNLLLLRSGEENQEYISPVSPEQTLKLANVDLKQKIAYTLLPQYLYINLYINKNKGDIT